MAHKGNTKPAFSQVQRYLGTRMTGFKSLFGNENKAASLTLKFFSFFVLFVSLLGFLVYPSRTRGGSKGKVQGVYPPPPPPREMTCDFLIQLVFCIKICLRHQSVTPFLSGAPPPKKPPGSAPAYGILTPPLKRFILYRHHMTVRNFTLTS